MWKYATISIMTLIIAINFSSLGYEIKGRNIKIDRYEGRCIGKRVPMVLVPEKFITDGNNFWFNASLTIKENINDPINMSIKIERCRIRDKPDTCQIINTFKVAKFCDLLKSNMEFWSPIYSAYKPPFRCPLKKGVLKATNAYVDIGVFLIFPIENWFWKVYTSLHDSMTDRLLMCILMEARLNYQDAKNESISITNNSFSLFS